MRAGDLAAHGLAALDAGIEVRASVVQHDDLERVRARAVRRQETRAAVAEIRRRLEVVAQRQRVRAELAEVVSMIGQTQRALVGISQALDEITAR